MSLMARDQNVHGIVAQILNFPIICHPAHFASLSSRYELASYAQNEHDSLLSAAEMEFFWARYDPDARREGYHLPLLVKDLTGLPPACKFTPSPPR
jgi:hypothetical protein